MSGLQNQARDAAGKYWVCGSMGVNGCRNRGRRRRRQEERRMEEVGVEEGGTSGGG